MLNSPLKAVLCWLLLLGWQYTVFRSPYENATWPPVFSTPAPPSVVHLWSWKVHCINSQICSVHLCPAIFIWCEWSLNGFQLMSVYSNEHLELCHENKRNLIRLKRILSKRCILYIRAASHHLLAHSVLESRIKSNKNAFLIVSSSIIAVGQYCMILLWM